MHLRDIGLPVSDLANAKLDELTGDLGSAGSIWAIRQAYLDWSNVCFLTFTEVSGAADTIIRFAVGDHGDGSPFDGPGNILAHGFYPPPNGGDIAGDLHFGDAETWSLTVPRPAGLTYKRWPCTR